MRISQVNLPHRVLQTGVSWCWIRPICCLRSRDKSWTRSWGVSLVSLLSVWSPARLTRDWRTSSQCCTAVSRLCEFEFCFVAPVRRPSLIWMSSCRMCEMAVQTELMAGINLNCLFVKAVFPVHLYLCSSPPEALHICWLTSSVGVATLCSVPPPWHRLATGPTCSGARRLWLSISGTVTLTSLWQPKVSV